MELVLHIGTEKTGTTAIQNTLYQNEAELARHSIGLMHGIDEPNNRKLYAYILHLENQIDNYHYEKRLADESARKQYFSGFEESFSAECKQLKDAGFKTLVISNEHLHSRLQTAASLDRLANFLNPLFDRVTVVCYFREQSAAIKSYYSTAMKTGSTETYAEFTERCFRDEHYFNYANFITKWHMAFPYAEFKLRIFDRKKLYGGDVAKDFLHTINSDLDLSRIDCNIEETNESLGVVGLKLARLVNGIFPRFTRKKRRNILSTIALKLIEKMPFSKWGAFKPKNKAEVQAFYEQSNIEFAKRYLGTDGNPF